MEVTGNYDKSIFRIVAVEAFALTMMTLRKRMGRENWKQQVQTIPQRSFTAKRKKKLGQKCGQKSGIKKGVLRWE